MRLAVLLLVCSCTASASQVEPPADQIFFPTGLAVAPDDSVLFVVSANSDLRYDSGSIAVIDLSVVDQMVTQWESTTQPSDACTQDTDHRETEVCSQSTFVNTGAGARVGNFATDIAVQDTGGGTLRLIVPTRGDPSISWVDWDGARLSCNSNGEPFALCDDVHRLSYVTPVGVQTGSGCDTSTNPLCAQLIADEPFDAFADSTNQFAIVTHLTTGDVTLIDSPIGGNAVIADVVAGLFAADPLTGLRGSTGVAGRTPGSTGDIVYVGARSENRIQTLTVGRPVNAAPYLIPGNYFFLDTIGLPAVPSGLADTRGIAFSPSGDRMFLINRRPASLQVFDTSLGPTGFPQNQGIGGTAICRQSSQLVVMDAGDGERAYVTCFQDGQVWVIDPTGIASVADVIDVGRGPYAVVAAPTRKKIYVTNFLEQTVAVIDVSPASAYRDRVVLRIGVPVAPSTTNP
jgi:DNA-binding beta-propeller fold protein YncE